MTLPWKKKMGAKAKIITMEVYAIGSPEMGSDLKSLPSLVFYICFRSPAPPTASTESSSPRRYLQPSQLASRGSPPVCPRARPWLLFTLLELRSETSPAPSSTSPRPAHGVNKKSHIFTSVASHPAKHPRIAPCDGLSRDLRRLQTPS